MKLFSAMIELKQKESEPYLSGEFIFEALREKMGIEASSEIKKLILGAGLPDYNSVIKF